MANPMSGMMASMIDPRKLVKAGGSTKMPPAAKPPAAKPASAKKEKPAAKPKGKPQPKAETYL